MQRTRLLNILSWRSLRGKLPPTPPTLRTWQLSMFCCDGLASGSDGGNFRLREQLRGSNSDQREVIKTIVHKMRKVENAVAESLVLKLFYCGVTARFRLPHEELKLAAMSRAKGWLKGGNPVICSIGKAPARQIQFQWNLLKTGGCLTQLTISSLRFRRLMALRSSRLHVLECSQIIVHGSSVTNVHSGHEG